MSPPKHLSAYNRERKILDTVIAQKEPLFLTLETPGQAVHAKQRLVSFMRLYAESGGNTYLNVTIGLKKHSREIRIDPEGEPIILRQPNGDDVGLDETVDFLIMKAPEGTEI